MALRQTLAMISDELRPYPGRDWMVVRIVLAVLLAAVLVMGFEISNGWLSLYFCFVFAKPTTRQTVISCMAVVIVTIPMVLLMLLVLKYTAEPPLVRLLVLTALLFGTFYLANIMTQGDIVTNLAILFATVLTLPDVSSDPALWEQGAFWLIPIVLAGVIPLLLVTFLIPPDNLLPEEQKLPPVKYGLLPDRWSNPEHTVYALKCTFASMATYFIYTGLNFHEIQTAMMTCLILALPTTKEIIEKTRLRIIGAMMGAAIALVAAIWLIPQSNNLWLLLAVVGCGSVLAAWVSLGSPRISYAGRQMALAQFMLVTHSFGPSDDLTVLRDRLLGILLGNIMMGITFKYLWPQKGNSGAVSGKALSLLLVGAFVLVLAGCRNTEDLAPQSPSRPWRSDVQSAYRLPEVYANPQTQVPVQGHEYTLSELADMALRNNPRTRVAWEQARAAAAGVGAAESAFYPQLNLLVAAGYEHIPSPLPKSLFPQGYFYSDAVMVRPVLQLEWLLWDFGRSDAAVNRAREQAVASSFGFNAQHQQLLFDVCQSYYKLISLRSSLATTDAALEDSRVIEQATVVSLKQGFATQTELLQAQQMVAQYDFDRTALRADLRKAQVALAELVGFNPGQVFLIRDITDTPLPENIGESVTALVDRALASRPDLRARVAELRAAEASVEEAKAQSWPELILTGNAGPVFSAFSVEGTPWVTSFEAEYGVGIAFKLPIFDGFRRENLTLAAQAQRRGVEAELAAARNAAVRQVWEAFTDFENAISQIRAAEALLKASDASHRSTVASFKEGFASVLDVQTQQASLTSARERYQQARTDVFLSASLLQLATGQLSVQTVQPSSVE